MYEGHLDSLLTVTLTQKIFGFYFAAFKHSSNIVLYCHRNVLAPEFLQSLDSTVEKI